MSRASALVAMVVLALANPVAAQDQQTNREAAEQLQAHVDSLVPLLLEAEERLRQREIRDQRISRDAAAAAASVDTMRVGLLTIIAPVEQAELAEKLFTDTWTEWYSEIELSPTLDKTTFTFQWSNDRVPIHVEGSVRHLTFDRWMRGARVSADIRDAIGLSLNSDLHDTDAYVSEWAWGSPFASRDYAQTYRIIATTQSRATRNCLAGEVSACGSALGLDAPLHPRGPRSDRLEELLEWETLRRERLQVWYTPEERRAMVASNGRLPARFRRVGSVQIGGSEWGECVEAHVIEVCDTLLLQYSDGVPLPGLVRETLMAYALERGGQGAWARLLENPEAPPIEALEYASALPIDDLLSGWRTLIISERPDSYDSMVSRVALAMLWILFFSFLATRSTRWRLG